MSNLGLTQEKPIRRFLRQILNPRLAALGALSIPALGLAGPTGEDVVAGDVDVTRPDADTTVVDQFTNRAIVNWQTFSVAGQEYVLFNQPDASSVILNRIVGGDPSNILGTISANGHVFLVNPNGVLFGQSAQLDVHGLVATTLDVGNDDFMNGNYTFARAAGSADAGVVNEGAITAGNGGYVVLAGDYTENSGVIAASAGHVVLAAGSAMTLDVVGDGLVNFAVNEATLAEYAGVRNTGQIFADGGMVLMTAKVANELVTTAVNNEGLVQAHSIQERDGIIYLAAEGGDIVNAGTLDADGANGEDGGAVIVRSDRNIDLANGGVITVAGDSSASGGVARVIAEDTLYFRENATIRATGGNANGGFVEVSGHGNLMLRGIMEIGAGGNLLIDPTTITLVSGSGSPVLSNSITTLGVGYIGNQLNTGVDVTLVASGSINSNISLTPQTIAAPSYAGNLGIFIGTVSDATSDCLNLGVCVGGSPVINLLGTGTINISNIDINILGNVTVEAPSGNVALGDITTPGNISISGGNISVSALNDAASVSLTASSAAARGGNITLGGKSQFGSNVSNLTINTTGGSSGGNVTLIGAQITNNLTVNARGGANGGIITIGDASFTGISGGTSGGNSFNFTGNRMDFVGGVFLVGNLGINANVTGNIQIGFDGAPSFTPNNVDINGTVNANSVSIFTTQGTVTAGDIATTVGDVSITAGHQISIGNVNAAGNANFIGNSGGQPGTGVGRLFAGSITAGGNVTADMLGDSISGYGGGVINVSGNIDADGSVNFRADNNGGSQTAQIGIFGSITAGGAISLTQAGNTNTFRAVEVNNSGVGGAAITAGGDVTIAGNGDVIIGGSSGFESGDFFGETVTTTNGLINIGANSGNIQVGGLSATGSISLNVSNGDHILVGSLDFNPTFGTSAVSNTQDINTGGPVSLFISGSNIGGPIRVDAGNVSGSNVGISVANPADGNGSALINVGNVSANGTSTGGNIFINANANVFGSVGRGVVNAGALTANNFIDVSANGSGAAGFGSINFAGGSAGGNLSANVSAPNGNIQITNDFTAGGSISVSAPGQIAAGVGSFFEGGFTGAQLTATTGNIFISGLGNIHVGGLAAGADIFTEIKSGGFGSEIIVGSGSLGTFGTPFVAGNVSAGGQVNLLVNTSGSGGRILAGDVGGTSIFINNQRGRGSISVGNLTAVNTGNPGMVDVIAGNFSYGGDITVNGSITAEGRAEASQFCGTEVPCQFGPFGQPLAAHVQLRSENGTTTGTITVSGDINVTANAAAFEIESFDSFNGITTNVSGTGGLAGVFIESRLNAVSVGGNVNLTGPDAHVGLFGTVVGAGNVSATASGHDITIQQTDGNNSFSSTNNAGNVVLHVTNFSNPTGANSIDLGNISLNGRGNGEIILQGALINTGGLGAAVSAATYQRNGTPLSDPRSGGLVESGPFATTNFEEGELNITQGTVTAGRAAVNLFGQAFQALCEGPCPESETPPLAQSINVGGNISVTGDGAAQVGLFAGGISVTGGINVDAGAGTVDGTGTGLFFFDSTTSTSYEVAVTQQGDIGHGQVDLFTSSGDIAVGGDIVMSGLTGGFEIDANNGNVNMGGISVTGTGGVFTASNVFTVISGAGSDFSTSFSGPAERTLGTIAGNNVTVNGNVNISGAGIVGAMIAGIGNAPVINGNVTLGATNASITQFDSRNMSSPVTTTFGDAALLIGELSDGVVVGPADINGSVTFNAERDAHLLINADIRDALIVNAGRRIDTLLPAIYQDEDDPDAIPPVTLSVTAGGLGMTAGTSINFSGGTLNVDTNQNIAVVAGNFVNFGTATLETTQLLSVTVGGDIINGIGSFTADGLALITTTSINMGSTTFTIGDGVFPDIPGDQLLLQGLAVESLTPLSSSPNGYFAAGTQIQVGATSVAGGYLLIETNDVTFTGNITGPENLLVQFVPFAGVGDVFIENTEPAGSSLILSTADLLAVQDSATITIGDSLYAGNVIVGTAGAINLGDRNFIVATTGEVNDLKNVTSTGLVTELSTLLAGAFDEPTLDEIDPKAGLGSNFEDYEIGEEGEEEGEDTDGDGVPDTESDNSLIKHDTSDQTQICAAG